MTHLFKQLLSKLQSRSARRAAARRRQRVAHFHPVGGLALADRLEDRTLLAVDLDPIGDQVMSHRDDLLIIELTAGQSPPQTLTYSASAFTTDPLAELAYDLDQQYGLFDYTGGHYWYDYFGLQEKWMEGFGREYYYITPDGGLYFYNGSIETSPLIGTLSSEYHADPALLHDALPPSPVPADATATTIGNTLIIDPLAGFLGDFLVTVNVTDGVDSDSETFTVSVINSAPVVAGIEDQIIGNDGDSLVIPLSAFDPDGDPISYSVSDADPLAALAYQVDQQYGLFDYTNGHYWFDYFGLQEKWMEGFGREYYYITPDGNVYFYNGSIATSPLIATLDGSYHANPAKLHDALDPSLLTGNVNESLVGNLLILVPDDGYVGQSSITVQASDGIDSSETTFTLSVLSVIAGNVPIAEEPLTPLNLGVEQTGDGPQTTVWQHGGKWWSVQCDGDGAHVWRLDGVNWTRTLTLSSTPATTTDVKVQGDVVHILMQTGTGTVLRTIQYSDGESGVYEPWSVQPNLVTIPGTGGSSSASIDVDSTGRMWVVYSAGGLVQIRHSDGPYTAWSSAISLATGLASDDVATVSALPNGTLGVMWTNRNTGQAGFRVHVDGDDPNLWSTDEAPDVNNQLAAGHLSTVVHPDGTLYAAIETDDGAGPMDAALLVRRPGGDWGPLHVIDATGSQPIVQLAEATETLLLIYRDTGSAGPIVFREIIDNGVDLTVGVEHTLIDGDGIVNESSLARPSGSKAAGTNELLVVARAGETSTAVHLYLDLHNDMPGAVEDSYTVAEAGTLVVADANGTTGGTADDGVLVNDVSGGGALTAMLVRAPAFGTVSFNGNGTFTYTHDGSENFTDQFRYRAFEGAEPGSIATVHITVTPVNDPPVAVEDQYNVAEGETLAANDATGQVGGSNDNGVVANDVDAEGDSLTVTLVQTTTHGTLIFQPDGTFEYVHDGSETSSDSFSYRANDGLLDGNVTTVTFEITPVNDPPTITASGASLSYVENDPPIPIDPALTINDVDSPTFAAAAVSITSGFQAGADRLAFTAQNGITGSYDAAAGLLTLTGSASQAAYVATLRSVAYENTSDDPTATERTITFAINDGLATATASRSVTVTPVNDPPVALNDSYTVAEGGTLIAADAAGMIGGPNDDGLLANDTDPEGDPLTVALVQSPTHGTLTLNPNGTFQYTHNGSETLADSFSYRVSDRSVNGNLATVNLTVTPVNDPPDIVTASTPLNYTENGPPTPIDSGLTITDVDSATLVGATVSFTSGFEFGADVLAFVDQGGITGSFNSAAGLLTLTGTASLAAYRTALRSITYENTSDNPSAADRTVLFEINDGQSAATALRIISVSPVNDPPVASDDSYTVAEGGTLIAADQAGAIGGPNDDGLLANDADVDGGILTAALVQGPLNGTLTLNADGTFQYAHDGSETVTDSFSYRVNDGGTDGNVANVTIEITPVNDAPVFNIWAAQIGYTEDDPATLIASGLSLSDVDSPTLAGATIQITSGFQAGSDVLSFVDQNGIAGSFDSAAGVLTFTGAASASDYQAALRSIRYHNNSDNPSTAVRTVMYVVSDGLDSATDAKDIVLTAVNDAPIASDDSYTVTEGGTFDVTAGSEMTITPLGTLEGAGETADKPQSKVWKYANTWWAVLGFSDAAGSGTAVYRLDGENWTRVLDLYDLQTRADVKVVGNVVHVLLEHDGESRLASLEYVPGSQDTPGTYQFWSVRPALADPGLPNGLETATVDIDSTGRMWIAYDEDAQVQVKYSDGPYSTWSAPITLATGLSTDDLTSLVALPTGALGVFWSNQITQQFGFRTHLDGTDPTLWTADETPAAAEGLDVGYGLADDHMNLAVSSDGTLYVAAKTGYDQPGLPLMILLVRRPGGQWDSLYTVNDSGTRPIVVLHESSDTLMYIYRDGNNIVFHLGSDNGSQVTFGNEQTLITGSQSPTSPSSSKDAFGSDLVVVAAKDGIASSVRVTYEFGVMTNDVDAEGDPLTAVLVSGPSHGTVTLHPSGAFTYTHDGSETTSDSFTYMVNDGTENSNTATVHMTVIPVNQSPVTTDDAYSLSEGGTLIADDANGTAGSADNDGLLVNDSDPEDDPLSATLVSGPLHGSLTLNADGTFTYVHDGSETLTDQFTYTAGDGTSNGNVATVTLAINPVNDPPSAVNDSYAVDEGGTLIADDPSGTVGDSGDDGLLANDSDPENDSLIAVLVSGPSHGVLVLADDGTFSYAHDGSENLTDSFTYQVNDGGDNGNTATVNLAVTPVNDPPVAMPDTYTVTEGGTLTAADAGGSNPNPDDDGVLVNDVDAEGDSLIASLVTGPAHGSLAFNSDGTFTYVHDGSENYLDGFTYRVSDGTQNGTTAAVGIFVESVNDPALAVDDQYTVTEGGTLSVTDADGTTGDATDDGVLVNDVDPEGGPLTATLVSNPSFGTVAFNADGTFTYTQDGSENFADQFGYRAVNEGGAGTIATVHVTITPVNDVPVAVDDNHTLAEGGTLVADDAAGLFGDVNDDGLLANDVDPDGDVLSVTIIQGPVHGLLTLNPDGTFIYTHDGSETTSDSFNYRINDGSIDSNVATMTLQIQPVNDAPNIQASGTPLAYTENQAATQIDPGLTLNDVDSSTLVGATVSVTSGFQAGADVLTFTDQNGISGNYDPAAGLLTLSGTATFSAYRTALRSVRYLNTSDNPTATERTITFQVDDGESTAAATRNITVTPINDPPVAVDDNYIVAEGDLLVADDAAGLSGGSNDDGLLANDTDAEGDPLSVILVQGPTHGSLTLNSDGTFQYVHDGSEVTADSFTYRIHDGTIEGNVATAVVAVVQFNDPPVSTDDSYVLSEGELLTAGDATGNNGDTSDDGVLVNDSDPEGLPLAALLVSGPAHGSLQLASDGTFTYTHDGSENFSDSFTYRANDGTQDGNVATVQLAVTPVNHPPVAVDDLYSVSEGGTLTVDDAISSGVLGNDIDAEGSQLTADLVSTPSYGSLQWSTDGTFTYVHDGSDVESDSFTYRAYDGVDFSNAATVEIVIGSIVAEPITVSFQDGLNGYDGTRDATIILDSPTTNYGADDEVRMDGSPDRAGLLQWDLSELSPGSTVVSASITINVTNRSGDIYEIYGLTREWVEQEVTSLESSAGNSWEAAGALGDGDHGSEVVGLLTAPDTGTVTFELNAAGVALVQSWIDNPGSNFGLIFQDYANGTSNGLEFSSREDAAPGNRPMLTLTYTPEGTVPPNQPPVVDAGPDQAVLLNDVVLLEGNVSDDSFPDPPGIVTTTWSVVDGPGTVTFVDATAATTTAEFSEIGTYVLRLTANDGAAAIADEVTITVASPSNMTTVSFQQGVNGYAGTTDARILADSPGTNFGDSDELEMDGSPDKASLVRWDVASVAPGSTVLSASITLNVTNRSGDVYDIFGVSKPWVENEVTWQQAADGLVWTAAGASSPSDRDSTVVGLLTAPDKGLVTIELNAAGVALVQSWIDDPASNYGLIFQKYIDASNGLDFDSREAADPSVRPLLSLTLAAPEPQPLFAAVLQPADGGTSRAADELTAADITTIAAEAAERWIAAVEPFEAARASELLDDVTYVIADLPEHQLGDATPGTIRIDADAAGLGWFIDQTPDDDLEFTGRSASGELIATGESDAVGRIDLLSVVLHEIGHLLGYEHADGDGVMQSTLQAGRRTLPDNEPAAHKTEPESVDLAATDGLFGTLRLPMESLLELA